MSYKALYRTYRPSTFEEVAGQQHIVKTLKNALNQRKIAHAYLFCGPRGTGKTTMARLFAKALNCNDGFGEICNNCENCKAIIEGKHPDVIELDAASNRGIDDIRDLISKVKYSPIQGRYKVYIIDEVHMMTNEAFNALLKTLEEPPSNVVFILATTEPYKLMPTILSRCQRYDFTKVGDDDIKDRLLEVCRHENIDISDEALNSLILLSDGGMRDALSMLDQTIAYCNNSISIQDIERLYGLSSTSEKIKLIKDLDEGNVLNIVTSINDFISRGSDIKRLTSDLIEVLKDILIFKTTSSSSLLKIIRKEDVESLNISSSKVNKMIDILMQSLGQYRLVSNIKSLFEVSLLKIASLVNEVKEVPAPHYQKEESIPTPIQEKKVESKTVELVSPKPTVTLVTPPKQEEPIKYRKETSIIAPIQKEAPSIDTSKVELASNPLFSDVPPLSDTGNSIYASQDDILNIMVQATKDIKLELKEAWPKLNGLLSNHIIGKYASLLKSADPIVVCRKAVILTSKFENTIKRLNLKENQLGLSKLIEYLTGNTPIVLCLDHATYISSVDRFSNLLQVNHLPKPTEIAIDVKDRRSTLTSQLANELKGE